MTARSTMASLVTELRGMVDAGTADYTVSGSAFWTDDQLQSALDQNREDFRNQPLKCIPTYGGGTFTFLDFQIPWKWYEGGSALALCDYLGNAYGTANYTLDLATNLVTFGSNMAGSVVTATIHTYDLNRAAAFVWRRKAAHYAVAYDISTDNHSLKRSQLIGQCKEMADQFDALAGARTLVFDRGDTTE